MDVEECLLCGGKEFYLIHNHPNNYDEFSDGDKASMEMFDSLNESVFKVCGLRYVDDLLVTDNDWVILGSSGEKVYYPPYMLTGLSVEEIADRFRTASAEEIENFIRAESDEEKAAWLRAGSDKK